MAFLSEGFSCSFFSWVCGYAAATRYSPRGGRRRRREEPRYAIRWQRISG